MIRFTEAGIFGFVGFELTSLVALIASAGGTKNYSVGFKYLEVTKVPR